MSPSPHPSRARRLWPRLAVALWLCAAHPTFAAEPTSAELFETLQGAVAQEAAANAAAEASGRGTAGSSNLTSVFQGIRQARMALENGNEREVDQVLQTYVAANSRSAAVQKAVSDLQVRLRAERTARENAVVAEVDEAIARAGETALKSKTARDVDPVITALNKLRERYSPYSGNMGEERQRVGHQLQTALQSLRTWQDYLVAMEGKRPAAARGALQTLANSGEAGVTLLPRSELIARTQALPESSSRMGDSSESPGVPLRDLLARLKTLDDVPAVLRELAEHEGQYRGESPFAGSFLPGELDRLNRAYVLFRAGMPFSLDLMDRSNGSAGAFAATVAPLRAAFVRLALPRALGLPETTVIPAEESVTAFLRRIMEEAKAAGNWTLFARILEANRRLAESTSPSNITMFNGDARGLEGFLAGRNQEEARQWSLAVNSYQTALRSGNADLPVREIGERLERISREHPAEFRAGMEQFLNPPERPDGPPFYGRRGGYPGPAGAFPGGAPPGTAVPTPTPALAVPAIAPSPSPAPVKPTPAPAPSP